MSLSVDSLSLRSHHRPLLHVEAAKTVFDYAFALGALVFFFPFMLLIAAMIYMEDGGPVFFRQRRVGRDGREFDCLKFRTMVNDADRILETLLRRDAGARAEWDASQKLRDDPRVLKVGAFLRKSSLDELPQFLNVLTGDMSVVGPRPIVAEEIWRYGTAFSYYATVKPGITGLWQISGRSDTSYYERVALDAEYVMTLGLRRDLRIVWRTIGIVLRGRGAY